MTQQDFYKKFKRLTHECVMEVYDIVSQFPKEERYGASDQLRRAVVSIMLNYLEGFGRRKEKVKLNFFEISYGSLRESKYLVVLAYERKWITKKQYESIFSKLDEMGAMLWSMIQGLEKMISAI
ncbi:MAG TPA: four helix bundle protein [Candidatus Magasanikbacteria bacterium]|uniref:S23 ribosomal n=1 Tax=Candidatus Magasanikbacteria bacterium GW2011_GWE2_42_7 TaxID=1619052 RepID=A0A0G1DMU2_9BACT|nr:MAG: S23 ribosomal [Candidatus Magasanikbacteria bacterium GW2011_GWC2_42_27]KKS72131.1 MAG: S23 ribosomal [Candidatus Magasanikbacteria bacterium GW2011_GWE2_42_7]KKT25939.1 MAG: S23 ribosomal [Candidatus Magasanikbacteria bacterium GW2011_GWA2_43_9]HBB37915.1 four helix bundle protein [Candidatus Magasanikbacteria bacterium]HCC13415.1 four helix bundle protein [Candidatus Magasanikbacteria bacterium]